jgi:lipopolysaccharide export LptBFGC system permease protein LptF
MIVSAVITGVFIICGSIILGRYILSISENNKIGTYQMIMVDEKNIVVLDTRTGQYWRKHIVDNSSIKTTDKYA